MQAEARLAVAAGKLVSAEPAEGGALVRFRPRGGDGGRERCGSARIVNCTGPELDIVRAGEPLLTALARRRADPARSARHRHRRRLPSAARSAPTARPSAHLSVIGPVTRGTFWESVAVPDIRGQAERVAARLTA